MLEACIGAMVGLGSETHGGTVAPACVGFSVVGAAGVPGETEEDGAVGAVLVVVFFPEEGGIGVVDCLLVLWRRVEDAGGLVATPVLQVYRGSWSVASLCSTVVNTASQNGGRGSDAKIFGRTRFGRRRC